MKHQLTLKQLPARCVLLCLGLAVMALGVAFSIKASLGTSPISSFPYVTSRISGLSVGTTTIIVNTFFVLIQIPILRNRYQWFQLLQFPAVIVFGLLIDAGGALIQGITFADYFQQWLLCVIGILLVGLGVSLEVAAGLVTTAGEGVVLAICQVFPVKFSTVKIAFDVTLVCISILTSFLFLGGNCRSSRLRRPGDETMPETGEMGHEKITSGRVNFPPNLSFTPDFQLFLQFPIIKCV